MRGISPAFRSMLLDLQKYPHITVKPWPLTLKLDDVDTGPEKHFTSDRVHVAGQPEENDRFLLEVEGEIHGFTATKGTVVCRSSASSAAAIASLHAFLGAESFLIRTA